MTWMKPELDPEWVDAVALQLEVIYRLFRWRWVLGIHTQVPDPLEIGKTIRSLWHAVSRDQPVISSGGLTVDMNHRGRPRVTFVADIEFVQSDIKAT